jgi:hypothetical protein
MTYTVQSGDSLWRIASVQLGRPDRWPEIAALNQLRRPDRLLVGQRLFLPEAGSRSISPALRSAPAAVRVAPSPTAGLSHFSNAGSSHQSFEKKTSLLPARAYLFFLMDEFNPLTRKLTRKVGLPDDAPVTPEEAARILRPDLHGISPRLPGDTKVPIGRHVLGMRAGSFRQAISRTDLPGCRVRPTGST